MGKMKNYMMDMEDNIVSALELGAKSTNDVVAFAKTNMSIVDEKFIGEKTKLIASPSKPEPPKDEASKTWGILKRKYL